MRRAVWHAAVSAVMAASVFAGGVRRQQAAGGQAAAAPSRRPTRQTTGSRGRHCRRSRSPSRSMFRPSRCATMRSAPASLDDINRNSPLKPVFFDYDSADLSPAAKSALDENAGVLKKYGTWVLTIEGHCDERGTPEYNLALGERRAVAARTYLVVARRRGRSAAHRQLRQGISVRPGSRRAGVREEPPRAFRDHRGKVKADQSRRQI